MPGPNGRVWKLRVHLPDDYEEMAPEVFEWLRVYLIPACLAAPVQVTLSLAPPESDRPPEDNEDPPS